MTCVRSSWVSAVAIAGLAAMVSGQQQSRIAVLTNPLTLDTNYNLANGNNLFSNARQIARDDGHALFAMETSAFSLDSMIANDYDTLFLTLPQGNSLLPVLTGEQADDVEAFIRAGGKAIIVGELEQTMGRYTNILDGFGIEATNARQLNSLTLNVSGTYAPITSGPFGSVNQLESNGRGGVDLGSSGAISLVGGPNGTSSLAVLGPDALGADGGHLITMNDTYFLQRIDLSNSGPLDNDKDADILWRNILGLPSVAAPTPGAGAMFIAAVCVVAVRNRKSQRSAERDDAGFHGGSVAPAA